MSQRLQVGLERLEASSSAAWGRCGLLSNQASVTATFMPAWMVARQVLGAVTGDLGSCFDFAAPDDAIYEKSIVALKRT